MKLFLNFRERSSGPNQDALRESVECNSRKSARELALDRNNFLPLAKEWRSQQAEFSSSSYS